MASERLVELIESGNKSCAKVLAREIRKNEDVEFIDVRDKVIIIETSTFIGVHERIENSLGEPTIVERGQYKLKNKDLKFSFPSSYFDSEDKKDIAIKIAQYESKKRELMLAKDKLENKNNSNFYGKYTKNKVFKKIQEIRLKLNKLRHD